MTEYNIFEIVRSEKKNISLVSLPQLNKVFVKYYMKFMSDLSTKFKDLQEENADFISQLDFEGNIESIGNFIFHTFYSLYLTCFNIHISIFFLERATLLFYEFISMSIKEKDYQIESTSYINDAIIFTYKKTIGNVSLETILQENKTNQELNTSNIYQEVLQVRNISFLLTKILHQVILTTEPRVILTTEPQEKYKKIYKSISENLLHIYKTIDIDQFLFHNVNKILYDHNTHNSLTLIRILLETINEFIELNFFDFNNEESDIEDFLNYLETFFYKFVSNTDLTILANIIDIKKSKIYMEFKDNVLRYITN